MSLRPEKVLQNDALVLVDVKGFVVLKSLPS